MGGDLSFELSLVTSVITKTCSLLSITRADGFAFGAKVEVEYIARR